MRNVYQQAKKEDILHFGESAYNLQHFLQTLYVICNMLRNHLVTRFLISTL